MTALSDFTDNPQFPFTWILSINKYPMSECLQTKLDTQLFFKIGDFLHPESSRVHHIQPEKKGNNVCWSEGREAASYSHSVLPLVQTCYLTYLLYKANHSSPMTFYSNICLGIWNSLMCYCKTGSNTPAAVLLFFFFCHPGWFDKNEIMLSRVMDSPP